ncbi:MAG: TIR domain-containing protein [Symploca sp. SIO2G7]|nr:TIR domain-containing protein [Symploca sp. SIO2G7]
MDVQAALEWAEQLIHAKTGKYLNDLERKVFVGSWQNLTYRQIDLDRAEYLEKYVGFHLWRKLSTALGERVTKKNFRGALERSLKSQLARETTRKVFISHRLELPDLSLAMQFCEAINAAGYQAFMASVAETLVELPTDNCQGSSYQDWPANIDAELQQCDYFLLLLSPQAAVSEMVIEELRRARELRDGRTNGKPIILPVRVNCSPTLPLNHDLRGYLEGIVQREWNSPTDTSILLQEILSLLPQAETRGWEEAEPTPNPSQEGNRRQKAEGEEPGCKIERNDNYLAGHDINLHAPPLPVAEPELPTGQVRLASAFYLERVPYEAQCYREILQPGSLIRIKAPRQMGKTSLMARILYQAREQGYRTVPLSLQHADTGIFANLNQLLQWLCARITRKLRLPDQVDDYWTDTYGSKDNCTAYFEDYLLPAADEPLVLGLDEVDRVFQYPNISDDFFGLLRAWYEEAGYGDLNSDLWNKLRLVVVHSTEVYIPLNVNQSPFNVGLPIELSEFSSGQVSTLAQQHGLHWHSSQVEQLMTMVGGHPYLVRVALYHLAQQQLSLEKLLSTAPTEAGIYGDHLRRHLWTLQQHPELAAAFAKVVIAKEPVELESVLAFKLHSMGLVQLRGNKVMPSFELYRQYFSATRWGMGNGE